MCQVSKLRERLTAVKKVLESKDDMSAEDIKKEVTDLQQQSLKLFEMAYKKVSRSHCEGGLMGGAGR